MAPLRKRATSTIFSPTHLLFLILFLIIAGLVFMLARGNSLRHPVYSTVSYMGSSTPGTAYTSTPMSTPLFPVPTRTADVLSDPYVPPLKNDIYMASQMPIMIDVRGPPAVAVPVNIPSRGYDSPYSQIGILNRADGKDDLILPLMGKPATSARDKYNYYTISNTGSVNTKLPVKVNGKSGVSEYGCDELSSGDVVQVAGYNGAFKTTIYDNNQFRYLPVL